MNYYIADTHFGHFNIIKFDKRPFFNCEEMEKFLVQNWNSVVKKEDTVYILGDFCWSADEKEWERIINQLKGNKVLILGNHDFKNFSKTLKNKFSDIKNYKEITDDGKHVILCHYPILCYKSSYNPNCYMLHGHVHTTRENDFVSMWRNNLRSSRVNDSDSYGNIINVGCMLNYMNYTPQTLNYLIDEVLK